MANEKKVSQITDMEVDFPQWYTDIVKKAELVDYSSVRGCVILRPYAYAIWELMQKNLDVRFKETGHENVYMPMFIPENLLQKEKDHVVGFAPEVAWVTHGGSEKLTERLCVRPTSETLFCEHYKNIIQSHRDLPKLYNQWCSVVRWEKTTRPFLRTLEFLWQEGHTAHETAEEAQEETLRMLDIYAEFCEDILAIPVVKGQKTDKEKFAGAKATFTIESIMHDGKALQSGTTHNFGDGFAKAFDIKFTDKNNKQSYVHQTSWGLSTRLIGAIIMVHGDNSGLVLPPRVAPVQVMIIPINSGKEALLEKATEIMNTLRDLNIRAKVDATDKSAGWRFSEQEMKGVPLRIEIGPKDLENNRVVVVRRDTGEKLFIDIDSLAGEIPVLLEKIHENLYNKAKVRLTEKTSDAANLEEMEEILTNKQGFIRAMWCGSEDCENEIKEKLSATSRLMPFTQEKIGEKCVCCGEAASKLVYWGRAY